MRLEDMRHALLEEVHGIEHHQQFALARGRSTGLEGYQDVRAVLSALAEDSGRTYEEKDELTRCLLETYQRWPHALWGALLVIAYTPMLSRLSRRVVGESLSREEIDQLIVSRFLELARDFPLPRYTTRTCMHLRQGTQRAVFHFLGRRRRQHERIMPVPTDEVIDRLLEAEQRGGMGAWAEVPPSGDDVPDPEELARQRSFLMDYGRKVLSDEKLELLASTLIQGERIAEYVDRVHPGLGHTERQRVYQKVKRRHSRALAALRKFLRERPPELGVPQRERPRKYLPPSLFQRETQTARSKTNTSRVPRRSKPMYPVPSDTSLIGLFRDITASINRLYQQFEVPSELGQATAEELEQMLRTCLQRVEPSSEQTREQPLDRLLEKLDALSPKST